MTTPPPSFPFAALVGVDALKQALLLVAIDSTLGGVLIQGPRGMAKSTAARALAALLPQDRFVELPLGATEERLLGSLDLEVALQAGRVRFRPGLLHAAHDGVLYVDEVNLLPDALVDLLLDVAASGVNVVERDGVSHRHPARFALVGTMNPEEGALRPQLLDRFGLAVTLGSAVDAATRAAIVRRRLAFEADPSAFAAAFAAEQRQLVTALATARRRLHQVVVPDTALAAAAERCLAACVDGVRGDLALVRAARALAAWGGDDAVTEDHLDAVVALALDHRRPPSPPKALATPPDWGETPAGAGVRERAGEPSTPEGTWGAVPPRPVQPHAPGDPRVWGKKKIP